MSKIQIKSNYDQLIISMIPESNYSMIKEDFSVPLEYCKLIVPNGFMTDFASIPKIFWNIFPPFGKYLYAAVIHDYIYGSPDLINDNTGNEWTQKEADDLFYNIMRDYGVGWLQAQTFHKALRCFGFIAWNSYRRK